MKKILIKENSAFSLAEVVVTLFIIGFVVSMSLNSFNFQSQNDKLYISAFKIVRTVVGEIIADSPTKTLDNTFCTRFQEKVNLVKASPVNCSSSSVSTDSPNFILSNGMRIYGLQSTSYPLIITVDVNDTRGERIADNDLFEIKVEQNGKVSPSGDVEKEIIHCKVILEGITAGSETAVKNKLIAETGMSSSEASTFITKLPGIIHHSMSYKKAENLISEYAAIGGLVSVKYYNR